MDKRQRKALEAAGFRFGDAEDFLGLTDEERRLVELRVAVSRAIRRRREEQRLTQQQLAAKLKSSQSRVAKMETGSTDVSLDLLFRGLFAVGGTLADVGGTAAPKPGRRTTPRSPVRSAARPPSNVRRSG